MPHTYTISKYYLIFLIIFQYFLIFIIQTQTLKQLSSHFALMIHVPIRANLLVSQRAHDKYSRLYISSTRNFISYWVQD